jgi:hypothetical protein
VGIVTFRRRNWSAACRLIANAAALAAWGGEQGLPPLYEMPEEPFNGADGMMSTTPKPDYVVGLDLGQTQDISAVAVLVRRWCMGEAAKHLVAQSLGTCTAGGGARHTRSISPTWLPGWQPLGSPRRY